MSIVFPLAKAGLLALLPTLDGFVVSADSTTAADCIVYNGEPNSGDQTLGYFAVGWVDGAASRGSWQQAPNGSGFSDMETGEITCSLFYGNGDGDQAGAETAAYGLLESLTTALATDRAIGGALPQGSTASVGAEDVTANADGAGVLLIVTVSYTAPLA